MSSCLCRLLLVAAFASAPAPAAAEPPEAQPRWSPGEPRAGALPSGVDARSSAGDGVYGRLDGDVNLGAAIGVELGDTPRGGGRLDLRYFWTAGVYGTYRDALGQESSRQRTASFGVSLRPLFIPRWSKDLERGPALLDLMLDSLSIGVGRYWDQPRGEAFGRDRGFEAAVGLGVPLLGRAHGPWLEGHGELRFSDVPGSRGEPVRASFLALLSWQFFADTRLARVTGR